MKNVTIYTLLIAMLLSGINLKSQNVIQLDIDQYLGGQAFALNQITDQSDYVYEITRLQYYISDISITHDGGVVTDVEDVWLLVNANASGMFELGTFDINNVEGLDFYVGIGTDVNHEDPSLWPSGHPLAPQNPSMHWGWASGYRYVAIEGNAGPSSPNNLFEIHALGDNNYFPCHVNTTASPYAGVVTIPMTAEYNNALNGIDVSAGLVNHATSGASVPLLQNFSTEVFSGNLSSSVEEDAFSASLNISPNPSSGPVVMNYALPAGDDYNLQILDINGRSVERIQLNNFTGSISLPELSSGVYVVELFQGTSSKTTMRWVVK